MANAGIVYHSGIPTIGYGSNYNILAVDSTGNPGYLPNSGIVHTGTELGNAIDNKINGLDVTGESNISGSKTIASWSETDGKVSITTQDIQITTSQVTDLNLGNYLTGVKINGGTTYGPTNGVADVSIPKADSSTLGLVKVGSGLSAASDGTISVANWSVSNNTHLNAVISGQNPENIQVYAGSFYTSSDRSLKTNITEVSDESIDKINKVNIVEFDWKSNGNHSVGVIAQDVKDAGLVDAVNGNDTLSVNYIQVLLLKIASLEKRVTELEARLSK